MTYVYNSQMKNLNFCCTLCMFRRNPDFLASQTAVFLQSLTMNQVWFIYKSGSHGSTCTYWSLVIAVPEHIKTPPNSSVGNLGENFYVHNSLRQTGGWRKIPFLIPKVYQQWCNKQVYSVKSLKEWIESWLYHPLKSLLIFVFTRYCANRPGRYY